MTQRAAAQLAVDWQVQVAPHRDPAAVLRAVRSAPGTTSAVPVGFADSAGLHATAGGTTQDTGAAKVLGLPAAYSRTFPLALRLLAGSPDGALLAQQTAANLHVAPGDAVRVSRAGLGPYWVRVAGVVSCPRPTRCSSGSGRPASPSRSRRRTTW